MSPKDFHEAREMTTSDSGLVSEQTMGLLVTGETTAASMLGDQTTETAIGELPGLISDEVTSGIVRAVDIVVFPILGLTGIVGNIVSLVIMSRQTPRTVMTCKLLALNVSDLLQLVFQLLIRSPALLSLMDPAAGRIIKVLFWETRYQVDIIFVRTSALLTLLIALERFLAVLWPLKVKLWVTKTRMTVAIFAAFILPWCGYFFLFTWWKVTWRFDPNFNRTMPFAEETPLTYAKGYNIYTRVVVPFIFQHAPNIAVCVFMFSIMAALRRSSRWRQGQGQEHFGAKQTQEERKTTAMLLMVIASYVLSSLPFAFLSLIVTFVPGAGLHGRYSNMSQLLFLLGVLLSMINASINVIIYSAMNSTFAATGRQLFCCFRSHPGRQRLSRSGTQTTMTTFSESKTVWTT